MSPRRDAEEVLRQRAALLARPPHHETWSATVDVVVVVVDVGEQRYALEACHVRRVQRNEHLRRVPAGAGAILGVAPVPAGIVPVADLAAVLGVGAAVPGRPLVVVLDGAGSPVGLLVDDVSDVATWRTADVRESASAAQAEALGSRPTRVGPGGVVVLDGAALLTDPRLSPVPDSLVRQETTGRIPPGCDR